MTIISKDIKFATEFQLGDILEPAVSTHTIDDCFLCDGDHQLSATDINTLEKYEQLFPNKTVYDLSQNPTKCPRCEGANGELPCLMTSSRRLYHKGTHT
eukprot:6625525-Karenia_brevis.AAC.1